MTLRCFFRAASIMLSVLSLAPSVLAAPDAKAPIIRWPAAAGTYYPAEPEALQTALRGYLEKADAPELPYRLCAVIASPSPYGLAGAIAAHAFKSLLPGQYERVIVIAPSHGILYENCSVPAVDIFLTPLSPVALDAPAIRQLLFSPLFQAHQLNYESKKAKYRIHEFEYAIETMLPYLQERLQEFKLVPILVGDLRDPQGKVSENTIAAIADAIRPLINARTLVVVSSNFTHYGAAFQNEPDKDNAPETIARLDRRAFEALLALDLNAFRKYLEETRNVIDGKDCIQILLKLLPPGAQSRILAYETSATLTGQTQESVSYAAFQFHDPARPALSARPEKARPLVLRRPERIVTPPTPENAEQAPPAPPSSIAAEGDASADDNSNAPTAADGNPDPPIQVETNRLTPPQE